jgi:hypothetical protein
MKKKNKTYTVTQLNRMMMRDDLSLWEIIEACAFIDICSCYEPVFYPPKEQEDEWRRMRGEYEPEPTLENTSFYVTESEGTKYFYCGNTRTKVTEFFSPNGQTLDKVIENLVRFAAGNTVSANISMNC